MVLVNELHFTDFVNRNYVIHLVYLASIPTLKISRLQAYRDLKKNLLVLHNLDRIVSEVMAYCV